jgi:hypothetical protein
VPYDVRLIDGQCSEICDECGFDGSLLSDADVVMRYQDLPRQWAVLLSQGEEVLLRQRPKPTSWCGFEYARHFAVGLRWLADILGGVATPAPAPPTDDPAGHGDLCREWSRVMLIERIDAGVSAMLPFACRHEAVRQPGANAVSFGAFELSLGTALRHGIHDSEHHVLDVRRGVAALKLALGQSALTVHGGT